MATYTPFLNLEKPTTSERLDVLKINSNWDKIDAGVSALNSQLIEYTTMSNGTELNSLTTKANYMVGNISQMGHAPAGCGSSGFFYVDKNSSYVLQKFFGNLGSAHRFSYDNGSTWTAWFDINSQTVHSPYFGAVQNKTISLNQTIGFYFADFSDLTAPAVTGRTFVGYVGFIDTYRAAVLGFGGNRCYYHVSAPTTADATVKVYPMYL